MGIPALHQSSSGGEISFGSGNIRDARMGSCGGFHAAAVETQEETRFRTPGVWSMIWVRATVNLHTTDSTVRSRKNGAFGAQIATLPALTAGIFKDAVNTDTVAAGDRLDYRITVGTGGGANGLKIGLLQSVFTATADERVYRLASTEGSGLTSGLPYLPCTCGGILSATEYPIQLQSPAGIFRNAGMRVSLNQRNASSFLRLRVNEADTALVVTIPASSSGWFEDTVNQVTVAEDDRVNWSFTIGAGGTNFNIDCTVVDLVTEIFFGGGTRDGAGIIFQSGGVPTNQLNYGRHSGLHDAVATELETQGEALVTDTWYGLIVVVWHNGQLSTCLWHGRLDGADGDILVTVPPLTSGTFKSTGAGIPVVPTSLINIRREVTIPGTGGDNDPLNYYTHNFIGNQGAPVEPPPNPCPVDFLVDPSGGPTCSAPVLP